MTERFLVVVIVIVVLVPVLWLIYSAGMYVVAARSGVSAAWVAWIPFVGPMLVWGRTLGVSRRSRRVEIASLLVLVVLLPQVPALLSTPLVALLVVVGLVGSVQQVRGALKLTQLHGRSRWWLVAFPLPGGLLWYGLTLPQPASAPAAAVTAV